MKSIKIAVLTAIGLSIAIGSISCSSTDGINQPVDPEQSITVSVQTDSPIPVQTATSTVMHQPSATPTRIYYLTMTPRQKTLFNNLIQDKSCNLPCYLGITPGSTTFEDAETRLSDLGASVLTKWLVSSFDESLFTYGYHFTISDHNEDITTYLYLTVKDEMLVRLETEVVGLKAPKLFHMWSRYSLVEIFKQLGMPDDILVHTRFNTGYELLLVFKTMGVAIHLSGMGHEGMICPQFQLNKTTALRLLITDVQSSLGLFVDGRISPYDSNGTWLSIEEVLKVDLEEFYYQVLSDHEICFKPVGARS
jgi:hypothetical protein